jgi:hypothetical protein
MLLGEWGLLERLLLLGAASVFDQTVLEAAIIHKSSEGFHSEHLETEALSDAALQFDGTDVRFPL